MTRNRALLFMLSTPTLAAALAGGLAHARGFGGGGGFRGGGGGFRGGESRGGDFRGGYGGMSSMGRAPSVSSYGRAGGYGSGGRPAGEGMSGGRIEYGSRSGSYTTARGGRSTTAGRGPARGPAGGEAGRGAYGIAGVTAGGRGFADAGRAGGAVGPRGAGFDTSHAFAAHGASASRPYGFNAYGGYHSGWVHGYWNGHDAAGWGWHNAGWGVPGLGLGIGWGLSAWGYGSSLYGMGYMPYSNPYDVAPVGVASAAPFDYSQPIDTVSAPVDATAASPALTMFDAGRASFQRGDYEDALRKGNDALATLPGDTTLHEFRALCLFALGRYDEAAGTLYDVLSVGPGWDWTTLIGLYGDPSAYTAQLRALEQACRDHPGSAADRFVLAYQYLTQNHTEAAVEMLRQAVALSPGDSLSAKLLAQLDPTRSRPELTAEAGTPAPATADTTPPSGASMAGTWKANPTPDTSVALTLQPGGPFTWVVTGKGQPRTFTGTSTYGDGLLTLAQNGGPALVGRVSWKDPGHMTFRVVGGGPDDPGLGFSK